MSAKQNSWTTENLGYTAAMARHFPAEYLLRGLLSQSYFRLAKEIKDGDKVLDIGCLYLNNLMPFADRRADLYGVEVNEEMVRLARERAQAYGMQANIDLGNNRQLPFADDSFDFVLSLNTIHYDDGGDAILEGLREIARVGKPDCHFLISTAGRKHWFHASAERLSEFRYRLSTDEFRNGQVMGYFDNQAQFAQTLGKVFEWVEIAEITERYPVRTLEFYVAKCCKRPPETGTISP